ncbi:hypothetical protein [Limnohabitans sp.]|nr:hypothetical protein [Limnohabitans sp.]
MAHLCRAVQAGAAVRLAVWAGCAVLTWCDRAAPGGVMQRQ